MKIGHATIDERGKISGGVAGDQNKEVCVREYYNHSKGWVGLRAKDSKIAENIAKCMENACDNPCIGYDQEQRQTLYEAVKGNKFKCDKKSLKVNVECDCSSLVRVCLAFAGVMVGNFNTSSEKKVILATGLFDEINVNADGSNLKRGDILVTKTKGHTVVVLENGSLIGKDKLVVDGEWGKNTTSKTQMVFGTVQDGIISNQPNSCKKYLLNADKDSWEFKLLSYKNGSSLIKAIQKFLADDYYTGAIDGWCGKNTIIAMQKFLKDLGYYNSSVDGYMGQGTVKAWQAYINSRLA